MVANTLDELLPAVCLFDHDRHLPADGVPRSLHPKEAKAGLLPLLFTELAAENVVKETLHLFQIVVEVCHVAIPARVVFGFTELVRMIVRAACSGQHGKAFAERADP